MTTPFLSCALPDIDYDVWLQVGMWRCAAGRTRIDRRSFASDTFGRGSSGASLVVVDAGCAPVPFVKTSARAGTVDIAFGVRRRERVGVRRNSVRVRRDGVRVRRKLLRCQSNFFDTASLFDRVERSQSLIKTDQRLAFTESHPSTNTQQNCRTGWHGAHEQRGDRVSLLNRRGGTGKRAGIELFAAALGVDKLTVVVNLDADDHVVHQFVDLLSRHAGNRRHVSLLSCTWGFVGVTSPAANGNTPENFPPENFF